MKLLYVVPYPPSRLRPRPLHLITGLLARGHRVTVAVPWSTEADRAELKSLERLGARIVSGRLTRARRLTNIGQAVISRSPLQSCYCYSPALADRLAEELAFGYQVAHVEHLRGAPYLVQITGRLPLVWDAVDCISFLFEQAAQRSRGVLGRLITRFELPGTRRLEGKLPGLADHVLVSSDLDRAALAALQPPPHGSAISALANGVDTDYFHPADEPADARRLIFTGRLGYHANFTAALDLLESIMPLVWRRYPDAKLTIAGHGAGRRLRATAAREARVELLTDLPDIRPAMWRASVAVAPLRYGAGIQNKVLEAMSLGLPVVASSVAARSLQAQPNREILVADEPAEFAEQIARLFANEPLRRRVSLDGRRYVEREHVWARVVDRLETLYVKLLGATDTHVPPPRSTAGSVAW